MALSISLQPIYVPVAPTEVASVMNYLSVLRSGDEVVETLAPVEELDKSKLPIEAKLADSAMEWTTDNLKRLLPKIEHNQMAYNILDLCAESPEEFLSFSTAAELSKMTASQGRGQLQALTKITKSMGMDWWPVVWAWRPSGHFGAAYIMSADVAVRWKQIRRGAA